MTPQQIEAMKLALEALNDIIPANANIEKMRNIQRKAAAALREVLAEKSMQEVQRLGQEIEQEPVELCKYGQEPKSCTSNPMDCQCAIDAALAQPEQEPVAYPDGDVVGPCICGSWPGGKCLKCPRITTSPQRTWVGLTDEERSYCVETPFVSQQWANIEAKLKEKNCG